MDIKLMLPLPIDGSKTKEDRQKIIIAPRIVIAQDNLLCFSNQIIIKKIY